VDKIYFEIAISRAQTIKLFSLFLIVVASSDIHINPEKDKNIRILRIGI
jgi:hypothetical protein